MKRFTYEFVKEQFEKEGYELLSKEYVNAHTKLKYICPKGHKHSISWDKWQQGCRCHRCGVEKVSNKKRMGIDFIRAEFEKENYVLLSGKYINNHQKLEYICNNGHKHSVCWNKFQYGVRCPYCSKYSRKYTIDIIRKSFEDEGYILLTIDYIKAKQKLDYICPNGHIHKVSWYEWRYFGSRCPICFFINNSGSGNPNWKGGISCEPYCDIWLDKDFKESIKERDDHRCQNPDCWGTSKRLSVHHIDYDKKNCRPENLITLCNSCNSRANKDRERHKDFYRTIIKKKYILRRFKNGSGNSLDKI